MDYEKEYNKMLDAARYWHDVSEGDIPAVLEEIFPELRESDDEKIRKALIELFKVENFNRYITLNGIDVDDVIAWLEKQGEHKKFRDSIQVGDEVTRNSDGVIVNLSQLKRVAKKDEKQGEQKPIDKIQLGKKYKCIASPRYSTFRRGNIYKPVDNFLCNLMNLCYECFEPIEDSEQKPADKVEPKFKVGDWVVHDMSDGRKVIRQIVNITNKSYVLDGEDFNTFYFNDLENNYHLWTIQDAKDGDVLAVNSMPFIYNGSKNEVTVGAYCGFNAKHRFSFAYNYVINQNITPAAKAQYDTLMKAITEAGYTFDFEKKELKKIGMKTVWGEEDEKMLIDCFNVLHRSDYPRDKVKKTALWVKSLKDKIISQPQQDWGEEDNETLDRIILNYQYFCTELSLKDALTEVEKEVINNVNTEDIKWLKSIKNKVTGE